jgi:hypothetical protein
MVPTQVCIICTKPMMPGDYFYGAHIACAKRAVDTLAKQEKTTKLTR